jgi:hypothetical protein
MLLARLNLNLSLQDRFGLVAGSRGIGKAIASAFLRKTSGRWNRIDILGPIWLPEEI